MIIHLASTSPRRKELIAKLGYDFIIKQPNCDENIIESDPEIYVTTLAKRKAFSVDGELIVGADTVVVSPLGEILGKPKDKNEAKHMFQLLCGAKHKVITGICVRYMDAYLLKAVTSIVEFAPFDEVCISKYIDSGKSFDKAGGYGIQDNELSSIVVSVTGDIDNVIGLPVIELKELIDKLYKG